MKHSNILRPLVSVIMPTFNQANYIESAIRSALSQSYENLELIVIDNHSTDRTESVVNSICDKRLKYYQFNNNGVIAAARNYGVKQANGSLLAFLDSDDLWCKDKLETQLEHVQDSRLCLVSSCFAPIGDIEICRNHLNFIPEHNFRDFNYDELALRNIVMTSSVLMSKKLYVDAGGFDESDRFRFIEDWEFWLRLSKDANVRVLGGKLLKYRVASNKSRDLRDVSLRTLEIVKKHVQLGLMDLDIAKAARGNNCLSIGKAHLDLDDSAGVDFYRRALLDSRGAHNKMRAMAGLVAFLMPVKLRNQALGFGYKINARIQH